MDKPLKENLPQRCARKIISYIENGTYATHFPSEVVLCESLQVSRRTVRAALGILEKEGIINKATRGTKRSINEKHCKEFNEPLKEKTVAFLSRYRQSDLHESEQNLYTTASLKLEKIGIELVYIYVDFSLTTSTAPHIEEIVNSSNHSLWIIYEATTAVLSIFEKRDLTYTAVGNLEAISFKINGLTYSAKPSVIHAYRMLLALGHRYIAWPTNIQPHQKEIEKLYHNHGIDYTTLSINNPHDGTKQGYIKALEKSFFRSNRPTAIITSIEELPTLISWLGQQRLKIQQDISVINFGFDPIIEQFVPDISYYCTDFENLTKRIVPHILQLIKEPGRKRKNHILQAQFKSGESHGPPATNY